MKNCLDKIYINSCNVGQNHITTLFKSESRYLKYYPVLK